MTKKVAEKKKNTIEYLDDTCDIDRHSYKYFIGIDPSYSSTGFVILDNEPTNPFPIVATTIKAGNPHEPFCIRLDGLLNKIRELTESIPHDEALVVMEGAAFASEFGAFKLGKLSGVIEYYLAHSGFKYYLVAPTYVKKVAFGNGNATKVQVINGVRKRWGYITKSNDINDAYVMARIAQGATPEPKVKKGKITKTRGKTRKSN